MRGAVAAAALAGCIGLAAVWLLRSGGAPSDNPFESAGAARNLVLVTIDTLRPDRLGAYGHGTARTAAIDRLAREGVRFERAFATAPITLTSHASLLTGLLPPRHAARHNGMTVEATVPTLATHLDAQGFVTAAFVAAFPLDRRFGLARGFDTYDDDLGRAPDGRARDERAGAAVVDAAMAWLSRRPADRFFLWVHLFEPHAPYGPAPAGPAPARSALDRYDDEIAEADRQVGRLMDALQPVGADTLVVLTADHGEAFGEHGEYAHSVFVYDTTLQVPLVLRGPGLTAGRVVREPVSLVDVMPTALARLHIAAPATDGVDLAQAASAMPRERILYAESFAPLLDFGWAPLRTIRRGQWKLVAAPRAELYDLRADAGETRDVAAAHGDVVTELDREVAKISGPDLATAGGATTDRETARRLGALGYVGSAARPVDRPDPKDRREEAARLAQITSGELHGDALVAALRAALATDPGNPQAHLRLGFALTDRGHCAEAEPHFTAAISSGMPSADPYLGRAACETARRDSAAARRTLEAALRVEAGNPVVLANLGLVESNAGRHAAAAVWLERAVATSPDFHEARFNLALAYARAGARDRAIAQARELLQRLPPGAPQRPEVERLLAALSSGD